MIIQVPRYISGGVVNHNGWIFDKESMDIALQSAVDTGEFLVYDYREKPIDKEVNEMIELHDIVGCLKGFDNDNIFIELNEEVGFKFDNPVALISIVVDSKVQIDNSVEMFTTIEKREGVEEYVFYFVKGISRIDIAEEDSLEMPRLTR